MNLPVVCFDLGNVLVHLRFERCLRAMCRLSGRNYAQFGQLTQPFFDEHGLALSRGALSADAFLGLFAAQFGFERLDLGVVAAAWASIFDPWPAMEALAAECIDNGATVWLLSNTDPMHFNYLLTKMPVLDRMAGWHLSYEIGWNKPEPPYYQLFLQRLGRAAGECVFFDDRPENVAAAAQLGMDARLFAGDVGAARADLAALGVVRN
ncbi:MAG: HAD family phosphatase [Myxococcales bacterium]|nr:HAD family phosphatase [Myxococcales bacterium]